jgi:4-hydroxyproline epimerase
MKPQPAISARIHPMFGNAAHPSSIQVVDSHTAGEPTRVVIAGGPDLGNDALPNRLQRFSADHDLFRSAVVNEPRGSDVVVGALLCEPVDDTCATGVIFFNNVGYLGMCGHGTIGVVATLAHLGRIRPENTELKRPWAQCAPPFIPTAV